MNSPDRTCSMHSTAVSLSMTATSTSRSRHYKKSRKCLRQKRRLQFRCLTTININQSRKKYNRLEIQQTRWINSSLTCSKKSMSQGRRCLTFLRTSPSMKQITKTKKARKQKSKNKHQLRQRRKLSNPQSLLPNE